MNDSRNPYPTSSDVPGEIAAGGVVWRAGGDGVEVLLVHRPKYGDWTFPKGKVENGESILECAIREVWEEAGVTASMGCYLGRISYYKQEGGSESRGLLGYAGRGCRLRTVLGVEVDVSDGYPAVAR